MKKIVLAVAFAACSLVFAAEHEIKMLNKGADGAMVFEPGYIKIAPGDTITFVATDPGHDAVSTIIPAGAEEFNTKIVPKGQKVSYTLKAEGVYVYQCKPHLPMGMVGVIQVGNATNADKITDSIYKPAKAQERLKKYIAEIQK